MAESFESLKDQERVALSEQNNAQAEIELARAQLAGLHKEQERLLKLVSIHTSGPQSVKAEYQRDQFASELAKVDASIASLEQKSREAVKREELAKANLQELRRAKMSFAAEQARRLAEENAKRRKEEKPEAKPEHAPGPKP